MAALAGCNGGDSGSTTPTPTTGTGSPNFELLAVEGPEVNQLNNPTEFAFAIRNTGTGKGTFTSPLEARSGDGEWSTVDQIEMPLSAGETGEWRTGFEPRYLTTYQFRLAAFDRTWSVEGVPKELLFDQRYAVPTGLFLNVQGGSFESTYPSTTNETATATSTDETATATSTPTATSTQSATSTPTATPTPTATSTQSATPTPTDETTTATRTPMVAPEGTVWVVMRLVVRNRRREPQPAPPASTFSLSADGESRPLRQDVAADPYEGGPLAGRTVRMGELVYPVPASTSQNDIEVIWERSLDDGDVKVTWA
jgi:hypothetical protein